MQSSISVEALDGLQVLCCPPTIGVNTKCSHQANLAVALQVCEEMMCVMDWQLSSMLLASHLVSAGLESGTHCDLD